MIYRRVAYASFVVKAIIKEKYKRKDEGELVLFLNPELFEVLDIEGMVLRWDDVRPGVLYKHCYICGMPCIKDANVEEYLILSGNEARKRLYDML